MPKSLDPNRYPAGYYDIVNAIGNGTVGELTIHVEGKKQAEATRFDFYGFQRALKESASPSAAQAARIQVSIGASLEELGKWHVTFKDRIIDPVNEKILEALERAGGVAPFETGQFEANAREVRAARKEAGEKRTQHKARPLAGLARCTSAGRKKRAKRNKRAKQRTRAR